jgi:hypothetical protein
VAQELRGSRLERDAIMTDLRLTPEQAGMAADDLEDADMVKLIRDSGSEPAGFSYVRRRPALFFATDSPLRGWNPRRTPYKSRRPC